MVDYIKSTNWYKFLFGKQLTPQQIVRRNQRSISNTIRKIEREKYKLEQQEKKQIIEIKKTAQKNQPDLVRALANDLVRLRNQIKKLLKMRQNLQSVSIQLQTLDTQQAITQAVYQATLVLRGMNKRLNMPRIRNILKEFEKQSNIMEIKGEIVGETMDDVAGYDDDGEESEEIISAVLDELGLQIGESLPEAPQGQTKQTGISRNRDAVMLGAAGKEPSVGNTSAADDELMERLERLRRKE